MIKSPNKSQAFPLNQKGGVLTAVLWIIVILSLLVLSLGQKTRIELALLKYSIGKTKSYAAARQNFFQAVQEMKPGQGYELVEESGKINLNALTKDNIDVLVSLLEVLNIEKDLSTTMADFIRDWQDEEARPAKEAVPIRRKNAPFDSVEELWLVPGMSEELFLQLKPLVTIYPKDRPGLLINIFSAPEKVLAAMGRRGSAATRTNPINAGHLAEKIVAWRQKKENIMGAHDMALLVKELDLNTAERILWLEIQPFFTFSSRFVRIRTEGKSTGGFSTRLEAVIDRDSLSVIAWRRW